MLLVQPAQIWRWNTAYNEDARARVRMYAHRVSQANEVNQASMLDAAFSCCSQSQQVEGPQPPGRPKKGHFNVHSYFRNKTQNSHTGERSLGWCNLTVTSWFLQLCRSPTLVSLDAVVARLCHGRKLFSSPNMSLLCLLGEGTELCGDFPGK